MTNEYTIFELIWTTYMSCTYDFHGLAAPKSRWPIHHGWVGIGDAQKRFERVRLIWERTEDQKGQKSSLYQNHWTSQYSTK